MADEFKIVASLNIPESASRINKDIPKLEGQAKHLKIVADLNPTLSIKNIQATLNKMNNNANIKIGIDASGLNSVQGATQNITNSLQTVQTQAQQTASAIKEVTTSITADNISNKMVSEFQKSFNIVGENAKNTQQTFKALFAELNNAWYSENEEKYLKVLEQIYDIAQKTTKVVKQSKSEISALVDQVRSELTDGSKAFISPQVRKELEYLLGTSKQIQSVLSTVYGVGKWSFNKGRATDILANGDKGVLGQADEIVEAYNKIQSIKSSSEYTILDSFDRDRESIDSCMRSVLNLSNAYRDLNGVEHTYIQGLGWFEEVASENEKVTASLNTVQKEAKETAIALGEIGHNFISNNKVQATFGSLKQAEEYFEGLNLGKVSLNLNKGSLQGLKDFTITVKSATGEVEKFSYAVHNIGDDQNPIPEYVLQNINAANAGVKKLQDDIEKAKAQYTSKLAGFESTNSQIKTGLSAEIAKVNDEINKLGTNNGSIQNLKVAFDNLTASANKIKENLKATGASLNPIDNAINKYKNMDNVLKEMTTSFNNLAIKPTGLGDSLNSVKAQLIELQNLEKSEGGYTETWAKKYRDVSLAVAEVKTNIELALKAEKSDKGSSYQTQLKYLNKIKEETNTIISLKKKMVNAGDEEKSVYQHEITNAQKRIQYDVQQLDKKKLLTDEAKRLVNTYKEQIALQDRINSAKTSDKNVQAQSQQLKDYVTQVSKAIVRLNSLQNSPTFTKNASNPQVTQTKQDINSLITAYQNLATKLQGNITPAGLETVRTELTQLNARFNDATTTAKRFETELRNDNGAEKQAQRIALLKAQIDAYAKANPKAMKQFGDAFNNMITTLNSSPDKITVDRVAKQFQTLRQEINKADLAGKTLWQTFEEKSKKFIGWMSMTFLYSSMFRAFRSAITNVIELDKAMTNLKKVTDETDTAYAKFLNNASTQAKELHSTITDLVEQTAVWAKLGYSLNEAQNLATTSMIYSKVGEVENSKSVSDLVTVMKAFNIESEKSIRIVDSLNELGNNFATSASDLGEGLTKSASALQVANNSFEQSIALLTGGTEITQNANEMGSALKVISMRIRGKNICLRIRKVYTPCYA